MLDNRLIFPDVRNIACNTNLLEWANHVVAKLIDAKTSVKYVVQFLLS